MLLENKVVLITGASRGIGRATAIEVARQGADVAINSFRDAEAAAEVVAAIEAAGGKAWSHRADVADEAQVEAMVKAVLEREGRIEQQLPVGLGRRQHLARVHDAKRIECFFDRTHQTHFNRRLVARGFIAP